MRKAVILDRDGTLNVDHGYVYRKEDWQFTPGAPEALKKLQDAGFVLTIATGQSGIGRGKYSEDDMHTLHTHMRALLKDSAVVIEAIAFCPHAPEEGCVCRKPGLGMYTQLVDAVGPIDSAQSWMVGDKLDDLRFGVAADLNTVLLKSRYWHEDELVALNVKPTFVAATLHEAAKFIVKVLPR